MRILLLLFFLLTNHVYADGGFKLFARGLSARDIYVYLPAGYENSKRTYKVLYMHDGQNLFDPSRAFLGQTWKAEKTLNDLINRQIIEPIIVVGIDNTSERGNEYIPEHSGDVYLKFMTEELMPLVEKYIRVKKGRANTGIMGSSLGGLISLYAGLNYSDHFGMVGALSPSIWFNNRSILSRYQNATNLPLKIYLDSGTVGGEKPQDVLDLGGILESLGYVKNQDYVSVIQSGADHREAYWAERLPVALEFLFN
jgi:predicted alpha/beta superfamily hydrolase